MKAILTALGILLVLSSQVWAEQPVPKRSQATVRITNGEWAPYLSPNLPHHGIASRIITEAFAQEGISVVFGFFPWKRSMDMAREGSWDATAVWHRSLEREQDFFISDPVLTSRYVFFHRSDRVFSWSTLADLQGIRIGGTIEYDYGNEFSAAEKLNQIIVERVARDELNFRKLMAGRVDVFPMDQVVGLHMIARNFPLEARDQLTFHPQPLRSDGLHLLFSRRVAGNAERVERFNRGLKRLEESGRLAKLWQELDASLAGPLVPQP